MGLKRSGGGRLMRTKQITGLGGATRQKRMHDLNTKGEPAEGSIILASDRPISVSRNIEAPLKGVTRSQGA